MSTEERCPECGSWGAECMSDKPVPGCGCARCLSAALAQANRERDEARAARDHFKEQLRERAEALLDARAEVERLRLDNADLLARLDAAAFAVQQGLHAVAERQREACARAAEEDVSLGRTHEAVRATPLVTEGDK